jgi:hypothetical protein
LQSEFVFGTEEVLKIVCEAELKSAEKRPRRGLIEEVEDQVEEKEKGVIHAN